jgi:hypothetical protein
VQETPYGRLRKPTYPRPAGVARTKERRDAGMENGMERAEGSGLEGKELWEKLKEAARAAGSVAAACRNLGISRSAYYRHREAWGAEGRRASLPESARHKHRILRLALANPEWGCVRISYFLELHGIRISSPTVQKILKAENLGRVKQRLAASGPHPAGDGEVPVPLRRRALVQAPKQQIGCADRQYR